MLSLLTPNHFPSVRNPTNVLITLEFTLPQHADAFINIDHIVEIHFSAKLKLHRYSSNKDIHLKGKAEVGCLTGICIWKLPLS